MRSGSRGFTYLGLLFGIALLGLALVGASEVWVTTTRRAQLEQLAWVEQQFSQAITSYYESSPGTAKKYPASVDDLLEDKRYPFARRHLRQFYRNPLTNELDWQVVRSADGGIRVMRAEPAK